MTDKNHSLRTSTSSPVPAADAAEGPVPLMLAQAVVVASVMCVCEIICAPVIISMVSGAFALVPWAAVACLLAVVFMAVLGFAFLWLADNIAHNFPARFAPVSYGIVGMASFGIWGGLIYPTFINSVLEPAGLPSISGGNVWAIVFNCAIIGLVGFLLAAIFAPRLSRRVPACVAMGVVVLALSALGAFFLWGFYSTLG
ncbi:4-hydroxybenzoate polyprenyltransferase [Bifidobacterium primatium]|nr:4-hydroxybenzoate polyprenyltransferase [Bifidobacterium primatium]